MTETKIPCKCDPPGSGEEYCTGDCGVTHAFNPGTAVPVCYECGHPKEDHTPWPIPPLADPSGMLGWTNQEVANMLAVKDAERERLRDAFKTESDALFNLINGVKKELISRDWLIEGRGSYEWDDDRYRHEARLAFDAAKAVLQEAVEPGRIRYLAVLGPEPTNSERKG